jgi:hypothetical protein
MLPTLCPKISILPELGSVSRIKHFKRVDFPDPLAPMIASETPENAANVTLRSTTGPP